MALLEEAESREVSMLSHQGGKLPKKRAHIEAMCAGRFVAHYYLYENDLIRSLYLANLSDCD